MSDTPRVDAFVKDQRQSWESLSDASADYNALLTFARYLERTMNPRKQVKKPKLGARGKF